jgi:hypothetical protein
VLEAILRPTFRGGEPGEFTRALLMGAGRLINLAIAEWLIRRPT